MSRIDSQLDEGLNVILGMDFMGRDNAIIDYRQQRVTFKPYIGEDFMFEGWSLCNSKMMISSMQARRMLTNGCMSFLALTVDKVKDENLEPKDVPIVREFIEFFSQRTTRFTPRARSLI